MTSDAGHQLPRRALQSAHDLADIQMTKQIAEISGHLGIAVHDHIIVGKNGHASLKGLKLI